MEQGPAPTVPRGGEAGISQQQQQQRQQQDTTAIQQQLFEHAQRSQLTVKSICQAITSTKAPVALGIPTAPDIPPEVKAPPQSEVLEYARYLGMDVDSDSDLLYIAEWALTAPVPEGWTVHLDQEGHEFFYNAATKKSCYEHPMDQHYKEYYQQAKAERGQQEGSRP